MKIGAFFANEAETQGITVRVSPNYLPEQSQVNQGRWFWSYHIRIENGSDKSVQLISRHWIITDGRGNTHHVDGEGVVGEQPVLKPGDAHDYVSGCPLPTPNGHMEGHYLMTQGADDTFLAIIPRFSLIAPATAR